MALFTSPPPCSPPARFLLAREAATSAPHDAMRFPDRAKQAVTFRRWSRGRQLPKPTDTSQSQQPPPKANSCLPKRVPLRCSRPRELALNIYIPALQPRGKNLAGTIFFAIQKGDFCGDFIPAAACSKLKGFSLCLKKLPGENVAGKQGEQGCL